MQSSRSTTGARRLGVLVGPALIGAVVLSSCGSGESGATQSTVDLSAASTAFVVRPPATTLPPTDTLAEGDPDAIVEGIQEYTVQSGDAPYVLVTRFGISLEDLLGVNEWTDPSQFPFPGTVILIPPGAKSVTAATATTDSADTSTDATTETESRGDADRDDPRRRRQLFAGHLHDRRRRLPGQGGEQVRRHGRGVERSERVHTRLQLVLRRPRDRDPRQGRLLNRRNLVIRSERCAGRNVRSEFRMSWWYTVHWKTKLVCLTTSMVALLAIE